MTDRDRESLPTESPREPERPDQRAHAAAPPASAASSERRRARTRLENPAPDSATLGVPSPNPEPTAGANGAEAVPPVVAPPRLRSTVEPREPDPRFARGPRPAIHRCAFPPEHLDEDAVRVVKRLVRNGFQAYLVGGCVRDMLLGKKPKDFDVATNARPHDIKATFRNCRVIGRRFRLAHVLFGGGKIIETATFRRDPMAGEIDADIDAADDPLVPRTKPRDEDADLLIRHDNVFGEPHEDALRRDFRMNGLFYDVERSEVIDFVGGMKDIEARVLSTIGLPDVRFREDPVRILRAIKFSARLDVGIEPECYDAMVAQREELRRAARARLFEEVLRLLRGGAAHRSVWLAWETGVLSVLLPEVSALLDDGGARAHELWRRLDAIDEIVALRGPPSDTVLFAAFLAGAIEEALDGAPDPLAAYEDLMRGITEDLALPRRIKERMRVILGCQRRIRSGKLGTLPQREFWQDALDFYEIDCRARGVEPAALAHDARRADAARVVTVRTSTGEPEAVAPSSEEVGRRRRRRRR